MDIEITRDPAPVSSHFSHVHVPLDNGGEQASETTASHDETARMEALMASQLRAPR